jgi:hypothetical protein
MDSKCVHVPTKYIAQAVQNILFDYEFVWPRSGATYILYDDMTGSNDGNAVIYIDERNLAYSDLEYAEDEGCTVIKWEDFLRNPEKYIPKSIFIAGYEVKDINNEGFAVGCHRIKWEDVDRIIALGGRGGIRNKEVNIGDDVTIFDNSWSVRIRDDNTRCDLKNRHFKIIAAGIFPTYGIEGKNSICLSGSKNDVIIMDIAANEFYYAHSDFLVKARKEEK